MKRKQDLAYSRIDKEVAINSLYSHFENENPDYINYMFEVKEQISVDVKEHFIITDTFDGKYLKVIDYYDIFFQFDTDKRVWNLLHSVNGGEYYRPTSTEYILKPQNVIGTYTSQHNSEKIRIVEITDEYMDIEITGLTLGARKMDTNGITRIYRTNLKDTSSEPKYGYLSIYLGYIDILEYRLRKL